MDELLQVEILGAVTFIQNGNKDSEQEVELYKCPHCNAIFGVDANYVETVSGIVACPMCRKEVAVPECEDFLYAYADLK